MFSDNKKCIIFIKFRINQVRQLSAIIISIFLILMGLTLSQKASTVTIFIISGTISTFAYKLMGSQYVEEGGHHKKFYHPYMQSFTTFVGEALCLILYFSNLKQNHLPLEPGKTPAKFYYFLIPGAFDTLSSVLQYMALNFISGSTYLMFKGGSLITTVAFSKILFGMTIQKRHVAGCRLAIIGLIIVGGSGFLNSSSSSTELSAEILGYVLMLVSLIFNGFFYAYEQLLMRRHTINPMYMVGWEGCFAMVINFFIALYFSTVPCSLGPNMCAYDTQGNPYFERADQFFVAIGSNGVISFLVFVGIITMTFYNLNGVRITKLFDALTRSLLNITRTSFIWIFGIIVTLAADSPQYQLESKSIMVNVVKGLGFALIITGTLIYNKIIFKKEFQEVDILNPQQTEQDNNMKQMLLIQKTTS